MTGHLFGTTWLLCVTLLCAFPPARQDPPNATVADLCRHNMDFAVSLYRTISNYHDRNVFFSPLSISTSFAALLLAADGVTHREILAGLRLQRLEGARRPEVVPRLFQLLVENITRNGSLRLDQDMAVFASDRLDPDRAFQEHMAQYFRAEIKMVNFSDVGQSVSYINDYIKSKTKGGVKDVVSRLDSETQLVLVNTIFFRGNWKSPFNPNHTRAEAFYIDNYNTVNVQMMYKEARFFMGHDDALGAKVLRLPYDQGVSLLVLLPDPGVDYTAIDDEIDAARFQGWLRSLREMKVEVHLPRFRMDQSYELHKLLPEMGVASLFSNTANLSKLQKDKDLKVSEVLHKAVINVDETGTTAAAATTVAIVPYSLPPTFIANRPFFFFIYHEDTHALLFMGRMIDPTKH